MNEAKLLAVELTAHGELYPKITGIVLKGITVYRVTLNSLEPLAFTVIRNNKVVADCWYPETDGRKYNKTDVGVLLCMPANKF